MVEVNAVLHEETIPQLTPAWQRGYDACMYGVAVNEELDPVDRVLFDAGVRDARNDMARDDHQQALDDNGAN